MTIERRLVLGLGDILAIRLECVRCHATVSFALDQTISIPPVCPGCHETWADRMQPSESDQVMQELIGSLKAVLRVERHGRPRYQLRVECADVAGERAR